MLKDFRVTDSLQLKDFRVKGIWRLHDLGVKPSSACNELRMRQRDRMQWVTAADTPSCGQKRHTHTLACNEFFGVQWITAAAARSCAMNYGCWYAIVRSEKTHTLACNECQVLVGHRAIRKDTHADMQRIPAGDVNTHADMQRIPAGDVTSYRQRRANGF